MSTEGKNCKEITAGAYYIKGKRVLDSGCNLNIRNGTIRGDLNVLGNISGNISGGGGGSGSSNPPAFVSMNNYTFQENDTTALIGQGFCLEQIGNDIVTGERFDLIIKVAKENGNVVAISENENKVTVFEYDGSSWNIRGSPFENTLTAGDSFGFRISLNSDGNVIAMIGNYEQEVVVYRWDGVNWSLVGSPSDFSSELLYVVDIDISGDGNTIVIGDEGPVGDGKVLIYDFNGTNWVIRGSPILGTIGSSELLGVTLSIVPDGNTFAVTASSGGIDESGSIKVFDWDGINWVQRGNEIYYHPLYPYRLSRFGDLMSISSDGNTIIGTDRATNNPLDEEGWAFVFEWTGDIWSPKGGIFPDDFDDLSPATRQFVQSVDISASGDRIAISGSSNDNINRPDPYTGVVRIYDWDGSRWAEVSRVFGDDGDNLGRTVSMTGDGTVIATSSENTELCEVWCVAPSPVTVTLPDPSTNTGKIINIVSKANNNVLSQSTNVVNFLSSNLSPTNVILTVSQKYATLQSDGSNWVIIRES